MSAEAIAAVFHHSLSTGSNRAVLLGIAWHTGADPMLGCYPSQETIAHYANVSVRQVRRALNNLIDLGELEIERVHNGGAWTSNRYFLRIDCPEECDSTVYHRIMSYAQELRVEDI